jgi:hypothetical protein
LISRKPKQLPPQFDELARIVWALTREYAESCDPDHRRRLALEISKLPRSWNR